MEKEGPPNWACTDHKSPGPENRRKDGERKKQPSKKARQAENERRGPRESTRNLFQQATNRHESGGRINNYMRKKPRSLWYWWQRILQFERSNIRIFDVFKSCEEQCYRQNWVSWLDMSVTNGLIRTVEHATCAKTAQNYSFTG